MTTLRTWAVMACASCLAGGCSDGDLPIAPRSQQPIISGFEYQPDPEDSGILQLTAVQFVDGNFEMSGGSGVLLDGEWVLTAAHNVWNAASPHDVIIRRGNSGDPAGEFTPAKRVIIHPRYVNVGLWAATRTSTLMLH